MALEIAHLSDLHVSRFGEHVTSLRTSLRSKQAGQDEDWEKVADIDDWPIQRRRKWRWRIRESEDTLELRLLDPDGYVQARRRGKRGEDDAELIRQLKTVAEERHLTEHARLARSLPPLRKVLELLADDPTNTNLLFLRAAWTVREANPDWILVSGDITDDGIGYDLVTKVFEPFIEKGRLLAIPGNHDIYPSPPLVVPPHERKDVEKKRALWAPFAKTIGVPAEAPWVRELGEGTLVCALDSCTPAWAPLSASGEVSRESLDVLGGMLEGDDHPVRLGLLHHHVVNPPFLSIGRAPWQLGMRLRNAKEVYDFFVANRFSAVLNGHRHLGYRFQPPWAPLFLSAPSSTLGDRSGARPYYWRLRIEGGELVRVKEQQLTAE